MNMLSNILKVFFNCQLILLQVSLALSKSQTRIVGGSPSLIEAAPYLVQVYKDGNFICGGSLISEDVVLSAAHCFYSYDPAHFVIVGGSSKLTNKGLRSRVSQIIIPQDYNPSIYHMDLAVIKLSSPIIGESVKPANLCTKEVRYGDEVQVFGWGFLSEDVKAIALQMRAVAVFAIDEGLCKTFYNGRRTLTDAMFCTKGAGKDACFGDSGGPAIVDGELCGIVSWGVGCGRSDSPGVYTHIMKAKSFINDALKQ